MTKGSSDGVLRIANCSGFYGDRLSAAREMVEGGPIDVLTGDYLAELTMMILHKDRLAHPSGGFAKTFLLQLRQVAKACLDRGIRIVVNAGGLNPRGCAEACRAIYAELGLEARVAHIEGDDLLPGLEQLGAEGESFEHLDRGIALATLPAERKVLSANAYLGAWGIARALGNGADLVICPRVTDASLVVGPAAWRFGWARDDWDRLASAVVAGHILECGAQATGGNYSFFQEVEGLEHPGFPLAEMHRDGSFVITKHEGTGGEVSVGTVTAQLLYEIDSPRYLGPDVTARFDSIRVQQEAENRVRVNGVEGEPPPPKTKVCINYHGGFRNSVTFLLGGLDIEAKAELAERTLWQRLGGEESFDATATVLHRGAEDGFSFLTLAAKDTDPKKVGRRFSAAAVEMALASYPGFNLTAPPGKESPFGIYWPALVASERLQHRVVVDDEVIPIPPTPGSPPEPWLSEPWLSEPWLSEPGAATTGAAPDSFGETRERPLGTICGARSGDKGGNANLGIWVGSEQAYAWLCSWLTVERIRELIPDTLDRVIDRYPLPNLLAMNFVLRGHLGEGVAASLATDAQAKGLGEILRSRKAPIPVALLVSGEGESP